MSRLREETSPYHRRIEQNEHLCKLMGRVTLPDYIAVLKKFHGFYLPLEMERMPRVLNENGNVQRFYFPKLPLLESDLDALDPAGKTLKASSFTPNPATPFGWLGVLYTLEGSCLGRAMMWPRIQKQLQLDRGGAFFCNASYDLKSHWATFCKDLSEQVHNDSEAQEVIAGAIATFVSLDEWFKQ